MKNKYRLFITAVVVCWAVFLCLPFAQAQELGKDGAVAANKVFYYQLGNEPITLTSDTGFEFAVELPNGSYNVTVTAPKSDSPQVMEIRAEDQVRYYTSSEHLVNSVEAAFEVEVADGELNLTFSGFAPETTNLEVSEILKFDFGHAVRAPGYIKMPADFGFDPELGYGFAQPTIDKVQNRLNRASTDPLYQDAVRFSDHGRLSSNSFDIILVPGRYSFKYAVGTIARMSIYVNGLPGVLNITGAFTVDQFEMEIPDGIAKITVTGKEGTSYELAWLEVKKIGDEVSTKPTIWLGGDSTVCNYYPLEPANKGAITGWGQVLPFYLTNDINIRNYATSGQTTQWFREDGAFDGIVEQIKPGEYFICQLGINDRNKILNSQFKANLEYFVDQIRSKGGIPILVIPQGRADGFSVDPQGNLTHGVSGWASLYGTIRLVAFEKDVLLIDNAALSSAYFVSIGEAETRKLYADNTHPNYYGALELARIITEDIKRQEIPGIYTTPQKTNYASDQTLKLYTPELKNASGEYIYNLDQSPVRISMLAKNTGTESKTVTMIVELVDQAGNVIDTAVTTQQIDAHSSKPLEVQISTDQAGSGAHLRIAAANGDYGNHVVINGSEITMGGNH